MLIFDRMDAQQTYLSDFGEVLLFLVAGIIFIVVTQLVSKILRPVRPNPEKLSSYESGEEAIGSAWVQFNIQFYIIALIFLLFEVEIVFLFPWSTVFANKGMIEGTKGVWGWFSLIEMLIFIAILALGLAYAWVNGYLDWVKPNPKPTPFVSPVPKDMYDKVNEKYKK